MPTCPLYSGRNLTEDKEDFKISRLIYVLKNASRVIHMRGLQVTIKGNDLMEILFLGAKVLLRKLSALQRLCLSVPAITLT